MAKGLEDGRKLWARLLYGMDGADEEKTRAIGSLHQALVSGVLVQWLIEPGRTAPPLSSPWACGHRRSIAASQRSSAGLRRSPWRTPTGSSARCCPAAPWAGRAGTGTRRGSRPSGSPRGARLDRMAQRDHRGHRVDRPGGAVRVAAVQLVRARPDGLGGRPGAPRHLGQDGGGVPGERATRLTRRPVQQGPADVLALGQVGAGRGPRGERRAGRARRRGGGRAPRVTSGHQQGGTNDPGPARDPAGRCLSNTAHIRRQHELPTPAG